MNESYMNRFLVIDLTTEKVRIVPVPQWLKDNYVGGKGFGAKLLYDLLDEQTDPLGIDNLLMFMTGPLTSTAAPSMRACVICKSPLTGGYLDSFFGGHLGPEIKYAGYDGIIIRGRSKKPVYLSIFNEKVKFCDASKIWGTDTLASNALIKKELQDDAFKIATIGQAGENLVRFALICCEYNRQAGRGGAGAVMGSKNLKAIAVKGTRTVKLHNPIDFQKAVAAANHQIASSAECQALTDSGTSYAVNWSSEVGTLPYKNFLSQHYQKADKIGAQGQKKHLFLGKAACFGCPIRCSQMGAVRTGKHAHFITDTVEYETAAMLGANLAIHDIRAVAHLARYCDLYGVDTISMGNVIGFAIEASQKGRIPKTNDIGLQFGSMATAQYIIKTTCFQKDSLGELLGQGVKKAAEHMGHDAENFALHVKGMELPGWAPRGTPGMGLAYMTADRGACHQRGFMVGFEVGGNLYKGKPVSTYGLSQKAEILKNEQDYLSGTDTLVKCDFAAFGMGKESFTELYQTATGKQIGNDFFSRIGERIWNLIRCFNAREGFSSKDDKLPRRIVEEPLKDGPHKGQCISKRDMKRLLADYYEARGWRQDGYPTTATLKRVGIYGEQRLARKEIFE